MSTIVLFQHLTPHDYIPLVLKAGPQVDVDSGEPNYILLRFTDELSSPVLRGLDGERAKYAVTSSLFLRTGGGGD